jgi:hypothetical protein
VTIVVAGEAGGSISARVLHRRDVAGYVAAVVTITDPNAARALSVLGDPEAAGVHIDEQSLPQQIRDRFEAQKVQVVAVDGDKVETAYEFRDGSGALTENEFIRRYCDTTGSEELVPAHTTHKLGFIVGGVAVTAAGGALLAYGLLNLTQPCDPTFNSSETQCSTNFYAAGQQPSGWVLSTDQPAGLPNGQNYYSDPSGRALNVGGLFATIGGTLVTAGGVAMLWYGLTNTDGTTSDHAITKFDAELYAVRYNRALLHKVIQETREKMTSTASRSSRPRATLVPILAPNFVGLQGTF